MLGALEWCDKALGIAPSFQDAQSLAGAILLDLDRPKEAVPYLRRSLAIDTGQIDVCLALGKPSVICHIAACDVDRLWLPPANCAIGSQWRYRPRPRRPVLGRAVPRTGGAVRGGDLPFEQDAGGQPLSPPRIWR
jgi:hypothetical protein